MLDNVLPSIPGDIVNHSNFYHIHYMPTIIMDHILHIVQWLASTIPLSISVSYDRMDQANFCQPFVTCHFLLALRIACNISCKLWIRRNIFFCKLIVSRGLLSWSKYVMRRSDFSH